MTNLRRIAFLFFCTLFVSLLLSAQQSCYEQYLRDHNMPLPADNVIENDNSYDELKKEVIARQVMREEAAKARHATEYYQIPSEAQIEPTYQPIFLAIDTISGTCHLLAEDGTILADAHLALVDSTWYMWLSVDPLADKNIANTPYIYCNGNPIMFIDPDGRDEWNYEEATNKFIRISDKGGTEIDYYHFGNYLDNGNFASDRDFEINRDGRSSINSFRIEETSESTISVFHIPDAKDGEINSGFFLERPGPDTNASGENKRIPQNTYYLSPNPGQSYPGVPRLYDSSEKARQGKFWDRAILIHVGNYPKNTAGCLLPGSTKATNYVGNSKNTCTKLYEFIHNRGWNNVQLVIQNAFR